MKQVFKYATIILLVFGYQCAQAQNGSSPFIDSLIIAAGKAKDDTFKVKILSNISDKYVDYSPDSGIAYGKKAVALALKLKWNKGLAKAYKRTAVNYRVRGDLDNALDCLHKSNKIYEQLGDNKNIAYNYYDEGNIYSMRSESPKALEFMQKALVIGEQLHDNRLLTYVYQGLGNIYSTTRDFKRSLDYFKKAKEMNDIIGDKYVAAVLLGCIANGYFTLIDNLNALDYYQQALKLLLEQGIQLGVAQAYGGIASVYQRLSNDDCAKLGIPVSEKYKQYVDYQKKSMELNEKYNNLPALAIDYASLATFYGELYSPIPDSLARYIGMRSKEEKYNLAIKYAKRGLELARMTNNFETQPDFLNIMSNIYEKQKKYPEALQAHKEFIMARDSSINENKKVKLNTLEMQYAFDKKQLADSLGHAKEMQAGQFRLQRQRLILFVSVGIFLAVIVTTVLMQRARIRRAKAEQKALFARQLLEIELKALRAQMNPHFIFNCLNSIQAFIMKENKVEATEYLQKFSKLIRMILDNSQKTSNTLEDEVEILGLYMDLERMRLKNKFDYEITVSDDVDTTFTEIPSMVIQPLVENSIWHGLMHSDGKGKLKVAFIKEDNQLKCVVEDNGIGIEKSKSMKGDTAHQSKGMKLIEDRLKAWSQTKGLQYIFKIFDNAETGIGTKTEITILYPAYA